ILWIFYSSPFLSAIKPPSLTIGSWWDRGISDSLYQPGAEIFSFEIWGQPISSPLSLLISERPIHSFVGGNKIVEQGQFIKVPQSFFQGAIAADGRAGIKFLRMDEGIKVDY